MFSHKTVYAAIVMPVEVPYTPSLTIFLPPSILSNSRGLQGLAEPHRGEVHDRRAAARVTPKLAGVAQQLVRREGRQVGPAPLWYGPGAAVRGLERPIPDDTRRERLRLREVHLARFKNTN